jgi:hypothetical protein
MASSDRKLAKYCSIKKYLEKENSLLSAVIDDLCLENRLNPKKGAEITFLVPNKELTKEIVKLAYSTDPEKAQDLISACILNTSAESAAKFPKETSNKLGLKINLEKADKDEVVLTGGLTIKKDNAFKSMKNRKIDVWHIVKGTPVVEGEKFDFESKKKTQKKTKGGSAGVPDSTALMRNQMLESIKNSYANELLSRFSGSSVVGGQSTSQRTVTSLLNRIYANALNENNINSPYNRAFSAIASVLDNDPMVNASILLNPDPQLASILHPVYNSLQVTGGLDASFTVDSAREYNNYADDQKMQDLLSKINNDSKFVEASKLLAEKRRSIVNKYNKTGAVYNADEIFNAYNDLYLNNRVSHGGKTVENVFPENFISSLKESQPNTTEGHQNIVKSALARDLMRHTLNASYRDVEATLSPADQATIQKEITGIFNDAKLYYGSADPDSNVSLFNNLKNINNVADRTGFDALRLSFLNSTDFLYLPSNQMTGGSTEHEFGTFYNRSADAQARLINGGSSMNMSLEVLNQFHN